MPDNGYGLEELRNATSNTFYLSYYRTSIHWHGIRQHYNFIVRVSPCGLRHIRRVLTISILQNDGVNGVTECPIAPGQEKTYTWIAEQYDKFIVGSGSRITMALTSNCTQQLVPQPSYVSTAKKRNKGINADESSAYSMVTVYTARSTFTAQPL